MQSTVTAGCRVAAFVLIVLAAAGCSGGGGGASAPAQGVDAVADPALADNPVSDSNPGTGGVPAVQSTGPVAQNKSVNTTTGQPVAIDVMDSPQLVIESFTPPYFGTVSVNDAGTPDDLTDDFLVYTPVPGYVGADNFFYTVADGAGKASAAVNIGVTAAPSEMAPPNVAGRVMKGPLRNAAIRIYQTGADGSRFGVPIAATTTDANGDWSLALPQPRPALMVVASGGRYDDETRTVNTRTIELDASDEIVTVLQANEGFVNSSVYTHALYLRALHAAGGQNFNATFAAARADSVSAWGFDVVATEIADPAMPDADATQISRTHALAIGGAANALDRIATRLGLAEPNGAAIDALIRDLSDCVLDGRDFAGDIRVLVDGSSLAIDAAVDLNLEVLRFRNNRYDAYAATEVPTWNAAPCTVVSPPADVQPPAVTVDRQRMNSPSPALTGAIDDAAARISVTLNGVTYAAMNEGNTWSLAAGTVAPLPADGVYDVVVSAADEAGNIGVDQTSNELMLDSAAPTVTLDAFVSGADLTGAVDDATASVNVNIGGASYVATVSGNTWSVDGAMLDAALTEGSYRAVVTAIDATGNVGQVSRTAAVIVTANRPPTFSVSGDITVDEDFAGARVVTVTPDPVPAAESGQTVVYSLNPAAVGFADVSINPATGQVFVTAVPGASGSQVFTLIADDGQAHANFAARAFTLVVDAVNTPPGFVVSGDILENQDFAGVRTVSVTPQAVNADEIDQTVTYTLSPASVSFANVSFDATTGATSFTSVAGASGSQVFTVTANDGQVDNATASASFTLTVNSTVAGNAVPIITGQLPLTTPEEVPLTITTADLLVADSDHDYPADFTLAVQPGPDYTVVANTLTPATDFSGMLTVPVSVNDGLSSSSLFNLAVSVTALNDAPVFSLSGNVAELQDFAGTRVVSVLPGPVPADEAGQSVSYSLSPASVAFASVSIDASTGAVSVTANAGQAGSQVFTVTANDGQSVNNIATATFSLTVTAADSAPTTTGVADVTVLEDAAPAVIDLFAAFADSEDADSALSFSVVGNSNPALFASLAIDGTAGSLTLAFASDQSGMATLTLSAADTAGNTVDTSFDVTVNRQSDLRIAAFGPDRAAPGIGQTVDFTLVLQNAGPSRATDVTVSVPLPVGYTYVTANNPGEYNSVTGEWYRSSVNGTATLVITAEVNAAGPYDVTAEVIAVNEPDPDSTPGNNNPAEDDQRSTVTTPVPVTDLAVTISVDDPVPAPGDVVELTVTVENYGPYNATGITVTLPPLPGQLTYQSATPAVGNFSLATGEWSNFDLTWSGDPLLPQSATLTVYARVNAAVPVTTALEIVATLTAADVLEADGTEQDALAILVLADGIVHAWLGGAAPDPVDWHNPNNWDTGIVPSPGDNVAIEVTGFEPVLNGNVASLAELEIDAGTRIWANGFTISMVGTLDARNGPISGPGLVRMEFGKLRGDVPALEIGASSNAVEIRVDGDLNVNGDLTISQGVLSTGERTVTVSGDLLATGPGILLQKSGPSEVIVQGDAHFTGGDYTQKIDGKFPLSNGTLWVQGDFIQSGQPHAFAAEKSHLVVFDGNAPQTIFMQHPDSSNPGTDVAAQTGSRFANLRIDKHAPADGAVTLLSDVAVLKTLEQPLTGRATLTAAPSSGHALTIGGADLGTPLYPLTHSMVFDNVPLIVLQGDDLAHVEGVVFRNMDPAVVQLSIIRRSLDGARRFYGLAFESLPDFAAGGRYVSFENTHPDSAKHLDLELLQTLPAYGEPMTEVIGNASIVWGAGTEDSDRDGLSDADEYASGTNPFTADSDADGMSDVDELAAGADPFNPDSDGDGIGDGAEMAAGGDPLSAAAPGTVLYVRPAPFGNDANTGFGGWGDALASNAAVQSAMLDGAGAGQPFYVLYDAGVYGPLEIDSFANISFIGSVGPGKPVPAATPTTIFDAAGTPDVPVVGVLDSNTIHLQSMLLTGGSNFAGGGSGSLGGGVFVNDSSTVSVADAVIEYNEAGDAGGGAYVEAGGLLAVSDSRIWRNVVPAGGIGGGGIAALGGLEISGTVIADNRYDGNDPLGGGGGLYLEPESLPVVIRDSRFLANFSGSSGGAVQIARADTPISFFNNLIVGNANEADLGGGISGARLDRGFVTLIESNTVAFNRSLDDKDSAGGIHIDRGDDVQMRNNIVWYNADGDAIDELQDQFVDERGDVVFEYNNLEDFGPADLSGNDDGNPHFEAGFYLRGDSKSLNAGSMSATAAGLALPYTTTIDGAEDVGVLDQGYHYAVPAEGESYAATVIGETAVCGTDTLTLAFVVEAVGGALGAGHVVAVRVDGDDTAGGTLTTRTGIKVYGWSDSQLAIDEGDGVYRVDIVGVAHAGGETAVLEIRADDGNTLEISSSDLNALFAAEGC